MPLSQPTVLVAEDNALERKLLTIRLGQTGYRVVTAGDGVEALERSRSARPDLIVTDVLMPRLDGFRLCRTLRQDPELSQIPVVLTSSATIEEDDRLLALEMGASAFVMRTPDCRDILEAVRAGLEEGAPPAAPHDSAFVPEMRHRFPSEGIEESRTLLAALETGFDTAAARRLAHRWAGLGGTLGFPQISQRAYELEQLCETPFEQVREQVRAALGEMLNLFSDAARGSAEAAETPVEVLACLTAKRVALVGFPEPAAVLLARRLERAGAVAERIPAAEAPPGSPRLAAADLVILWIGQGAGRSPWAEPETLVASDKPLLVVGSRGALFRGGAVTRRRADDFLLDPWSPEEMLLRASRVLRRAGPVEGNAARAGNGALVLVVDDDPAVCQLVAASLENHGLECRAARDGAQALEMASELSPSLLVLDINMPGMDGFEVLRRLRTGPGTRNLPVVLLSARRQEADVLRGFGLGAADYVTKPFGALELVARVSRLLRD